MSVVSLGLATTPSPLSARGARFGGSRRAEARGEAARLGPRVARRARLVGGSTLFIAMSASAFGCSSNDAQAASTGTSGGGSSSTSASTQTGSSGGGASGNGGGGSSSTSTMTNCDPTMWSVDGSCGIFVSSSMGHDTDAGTKSKPVKSLAHAISLAQGSPIYACGEAFSESITLPAGSTLYGALDCAHGWIYAAAMPTQLTAPADQVPLTLASGAAASSVSDFAVTALDAATPGGSSIAVFANAATATLERCTLTAGIGGAGTAGAHQDDVTTPASADGMNGNPGCVSMSGVVGADGGTNACGSAVTGGSGGTGTLAGGTMGGNGLPQPMGTAPIDGLGGAGQSALSCRSGDAGADGSDGTPGLGASALGTLAAAGYASPAASDGASPGAPGQGGGGGGGAGACSTMATFAGPSGGGGGAGGCGGAAGKAGTSGGSSIGLASFMSHITIAGGAIHTAHGGDGGLGGDGQIGGGGGNSGARGAVNACPGGLGGKGGNGGPGGGGSGGSSLGVAFQGGVAPVTTGTTITIDAIGVGAVGGNATVAAKGADGLACKTLDLGDASSCAM